jgi:hypothetical protein
MWRESVTCGARDVVGGEGLRGTRSVSGRVLQGERSVWEGQGAEGEQGRHLASSLVLRSSKARMLGGPWANRIDAEHSRPASPETGERGTERLHASRALLWNERVRLAWSRVVQIEARWRWR